jgi:hypothetical protein
MMTQKTALRSIIPKDVMTSLFSLLASQRGKICVQLCTGFWQKKTVYEHPVEFSSKKLMRYRELCIDAQNPSVRLWYTRNNSSDTKEIDRLSRETNLCSLQRVFSLLSVDMNCLKINSRESPSIYYLWIINVQKVSQIHRRAHLT